MNIRFLRNANFRKLWAGQTISSFGSEVTAFALPLVAVLALQATPLQMGILNSAQFIPFLLIGLFVGVWVDQSPRRKILIGADIGRAVLLGSIPVLASLKLLNIHLLYLIAFCVGVLTLFFDVAYHSFLPSIVEREDLLGSNSKILAGRSASGMIAPGLAGSLVQLLSAPIVIFVDTFTFLISIFFLTSLRVSEPVYKKSSNLKNLWRETREGVQFMLNHPIIRSMAFCFSTMNFFVYIVLSLRILYLSRELEIPPTLLGMILTANSAGAVIGALLAGKMVRLFGLGRTLIGALSLRSVGFVCIPLAAGSQANVVMFLSVAGFLGGVAGMITNVNQLSLRQALAPDQLQGRVNANMRFIVWGARPIGSLVGGIFGELLGVRPAILLGACGMSLSVLWLIFSPIRNLRRL